MTDILINRVKFVPGAQFLRERGAETWEREAPRSQPADLGTTRPFIRGATPARREHPEAPSTSLPKLHAGAGTA